jgi:hypothetical protein
VNEIVRLLADFCGFLWVAGRYRIVESRVDSRGHDALVVVASGAVRLRFMWRRGRLFLELEAAGTGRAAGRYSIDQVRTLMTGEFHESSALCAASVCFLRAWLAEIELFFTDDGSVPGSSRGGRVGTARQAQLVSG